MSILSEHAIQAWRARVGEEEANRVSRIASTRGTTVHNIIEKYIANDPEYIKDEMPQNIQTFKDIQPVLDECVTKVYQQEAPLFSKHLGLAGRVDLVGQWKGVDSIIDWKTSRKLKKKEWVEDYYLQLTAYALAHNELYGTDIKEGHVFMCSRDLQYQQFDLLPEEFPQWESKWWDRVYQYYDKYA